VLRATKSGYLRRFNGGIAASSLEAFLREHSNLVPYKKLPPKQREWLVLNGFPGPSVSAKLPSVGELLERTFKLYPPIDGSPTIRELAVRGQTLCGLSFSIGIFPVERQANCSPRRTAR
jgi:hypothetical protein